MTFLHPHITLGERIRTNPRTRPHLERIRFRIPGSLRIKPTTRTSSPRTNKLLRPRARIRRSFRTRPRPLCLLFELDTTRKRE